MAFNALFMGCAYLPTIRVKRGCAYLTTISNVAEEVSSDLFLRDRGQGQGQVRVGWAALSRKGYRQILREGVQLWTHLPVEDPGQWQCSGEKDPPGSPAIGVGSGPVLGVWWEIRLSLSVNIGMSKHEVCANRRAWMFMRKWQ